LFIKSKFYLSDIEKLNKLTDVWKSSNIPIEQFKIVSKQLSSFREGNDIPEFKVFLEHLSALGLKDNSKIIEIGCSSGYYSEIVEFHNPRLHYIGIDYSREFVNFAFDIYPQKSFLIADANFLPLKTEILDCVVLGSVLLHLMQWEESLAKVAELNSKFLIVHRQPVIIEKPSYYYFKKAYSTKMFEWILNRDHLIKVLASFDYKLVKESKVNSNETSNYSSILPTTSTFTFIKT
jgi:trans-aconitate methyltransferase